MFAVCGAGICCAVGLTAPSASAAIRAGVTGFEELPFHDRAGKRIIGCRVPLQVRPADPVEALAKLAATSIRECLDGKDARLPVLVLVLVAGADSVSGVPAAGDRILGSISATLGRALAAESSVIAGGSAGAMHALERAASLLETHPSVAICGVDSYVTRRGLRALEASGRLKTDSNPDGLIPGEAAACVELSRLGSGATELRIEGFGMGHESARPPDPVVGLGLADAMRSALAMAKLGMEDVDFRASDLSGERAGFAEANYALARVLRVRKERFEMLHPAECVGAVGAASGPLILAHLKCLYANGAAPARRGFCELAAESGVRGVLVVSGTNRERW